jgi:hypothetical protein
MERERRLVTCAHHGCYSQENNLAAAKQVLKRNRQIGVMEIDFVEQHGQIVSSHDHTAHSCAQGSPMEEWIAFLCVSKRRTLYMDLKAQYGLTSWWWPERKFDVPALLAELNRLRRHYMSSQRRHPIDIARHIWLASQDPAVATHLVAHCRDTPWIAIADIPYMSAYVRRAITPSCLWPTVVNPNVMSEMMHERHPSWVVAIDCSFLDCSLEQFVREKAIQRGSTLLPYAFDPETQAPLELEGYTVIMVYNYRLAL